MLKDEFCTPEPARCIILRGAFWWLAFLHINKQRLRPSTPWISKSSWLRAECGVFAWWIPAIFPPLHTILRYQRKMDGPRSSPDFGDVYTTNLTRLPVSRQLLIWVRLYKLVSKEGRVSTSTGMFFTSLASVSFCISFGHVARYAPSRKNPTAR